MTIRAYTVLLDMNFYTDINTGNEGLYWTGEHTHKPDKERSSGRCARHFVDTSIARRALPGTLDAGSSVA